MEMERRVIPKSESQFRVLTGEDGKSYLEGTAIVFNKRSANLGWRDYKVYEIISPDACTGARMDEIICKYNHDINEVLGTTWAGTLTYEITPNEVRYKVELPLDTETGRKVKALAERGDLRGNSFEFMPAEDGMLWREEIEDGEKINVVTITRFEGVYDFAPVMRPAYPDTNGSISVSKRTMDSFNEFRAQLEKPTPDEETPKQEEEEQDNEADKMLRKLKYKID
jgi:phage head maturation protease